ncbi:hypothetical protein CXB51_014894 [Gossypium anomalum]|uniref:Uncharacterized protein n=1 Tax=Gossypium anomalum TaxID=47600 RepID=A0A8J5ZAH7_9ROSI|nr:hypothetical protein CXB51_014894 [Gossypium anomalum]
MDPSPFVCLIVESLALELSQATGSWVYPTATLCFCKLRLKKFPSQLTWFRLNNSSVVGNWWAGFRLLWTWIYHKPRLQPFEMSGRNWSEPNLIPNFSSNSVKKRNVAPLCFKFKATLENPCSVTSLALIVQNFGNYKHHIIPTRFYGQEERMDDNIIRRKRNARKEGCMIMIYDLSSSPITAASMITPFVPSPSSDRVSRSNLGAWLIFHPNSFSVNIWKPSGYKFELIASQHGSNNGIPIVEASISVKNDNGVLKSPVKGFVKGLSVEGEGKVNKPVVQVEIHHVICMADDALFVALSTAIDLSMIASCKLRKELCHDEEDPSS